MGDGHGLRFLGKLYKHKPTAGHAGQRGHEGQQPLHPLEEKQAKRKKQNFISYR